MENFSLYRIYVSTLLNTASSAASFTSVSEDAGIEPRGQIFKRFRSPETDSWGSLNFYKYELWSYDFGIDSQAL